MSRISIRENDARRQEAIKKLAINPINKGAILKVYKKDLMKLHDKGQTVLFQYRWRWDTLLAHCIGNANIYSDKYELPISQYKLRHLKELAEDTGDFAIWERFNDHRYENVYELHLVG